MPLYDLLLARSTRDSPASNANREHNAVKKIHLQTLALAKALFLFFPVILHCLTTVVLAKIGRVTGQKVRGAHLSHRFRVLRPHTIAQPPNALVRPVRC